MAYTHIRRLSSLNLKLVLDETKGEYHIVNTDAFEKDFNVSQGWKNELPEKRAFRQTTKDEIIAELRRTADYDEKVKAFIDHYDALPKENQPSQPSSQPSQGSSEMANELREIKELLQVQRQTNPFEQAMLEGIIAKGKELATDELKTELMDTLNSFIKTTYGVLPSVIQVQTPTSTKQLQGIFHYQFENILKMVMANIPLMLVGPAGSGKNHALEQIAETLELDFYFSNAITQEYKLTGFIDANGTYQETQFYKAFKNGGLFFFDEIDASIPDALIVINAALANGYFDFPNGKIDAHENFRVVAAGNTFGHGADMVYVGRNQLDAATLDRFALIEFDYDPKVELAISYDEELFNFIQALRKAIEKRNLRHVVSMRATINATKLLKAGLDKKAVMKAVITKSMSRDDINSIINEISVRNSWTETLKEVR